MEKLITSTPSLIACWTAATESELKQPCARQRVGAVTELAAKGTARRRGETVIYERWVLGPDAGVDHADDHVRGGIGLAPERMPDGGRADELGRDASKRLFERVTLHRNNA